MIRFQDLIKFVYQNRQIDFRKCENISLALTKFVKTQIIEESRLKRDFLNGFVKVDYKRDYYRQFVNRINLQIRYLEEQGYKIIFAKSLKTCSRLIVGLGSGHALETSMTLHHIFGIPYIPGTALKGVCRMVAFWKLAKEKGLLNNEKVLSDFQNRFYGSLNGEDRETLKYQLLFGAQDFKGLLLFLDAYPFIPKDGKIFDLDIMNVHYPEYYSSEEKKLKPPADSQNPNPIFFLSVRKGVKFCFNVLFDEYRFNNKFTEEQHKGYKETLEDIADLKGLVASLLNDALKEFGIGAKTRLGYGIFE